MPAAVVTILILLVSAAPAGAQLHENGPVAWSRWSLERGWDLMAADPDLTNHRRVDIGPIAPLREELSPAWSPDGSELAFSSSMRIDPYLWKLRVVRADGSGERSLTSSATLRRHEFWPAWSPDGRRIAFTTITRDGRQLELHQVPAEGGSAVPLEPRLPDAAQARFSPDGKSIAYVSVGQRTLVVRVAALDGSRSLDISDPRGVATYPEWSPDGRYVAYSALTRAGDYEHDDILVSRADGSGSPIVMASRTESVQMNGTTEVPQNDREPAWSPDGRWIVFSDGFRLYRVDVATRDVTPLGFHSFSLSSSVSGGMDGEPAWARGAPLPSATMPEIEPAGPAPAPPVLPAARPEMRLVGLPKGCARRSLTLRVRSDSPLIALGARIGGRALRANARRGTIRVPLRALARRGRTLTVTAATADGPRPAVTARLRRCASRTR